MASEQYGHWFGRDKLTPEVQKSIRDRATIAAKSLHDDAARGWIRDDPTTWMPADQLYDHFALFCGPRLAVAAAAWGATSRASGEK